jgi:hypothetical protein
MSIEKGEIVTKPVEFTEEQKKEFSEAIETYVNKSLYNVKLDTYFKLPQENKIAFLQVTRPNWKKERELGNVKNEKTGKWETQTIDYIPVRKLERLLNFLFNFDWSSELIEKEFKEVNTTTKKGKETKIYDAYAIVKFKANFLGRQIERTVVGSFKMYDNNAVSSYAVLQACISQAKRNFAKEFGIGSDLNDEDLTAEDRFSKVPPKEEIDSKDLANDLPSDFN